MIKMVVTDLDGTLLNKEQRVSQKDYGNLVDLGNRGILRVIATGRSPFSFGRVIPDDFPIDYLVFSSGAGVLNWKTREILVSYNIPGDQVREIALKLNDLGVSYKALGPVPHNHHYVYQLNGELHPDFVRRMESYRGFEAPISFDPPNFGDSCQFLIILPPNPALYESLRSEFPAFKVIRATSPMDHESIWMEIYHPEVSKAAGIQFICESHGVSHTDVMAVGNDFNDLDMLGFVGFPFLVANAPAELRALYPIVDSHQDSGFTSAVARVLA